MSYAIRFDEISGSWMVFNVGDGFELVDMHSSKEEASQHVKDLEQLASKRARCINPALKQAA